MGGRAASGFADGDANSGQQQMEEVGSQAAQRRGGAPQRQAHGEHVAPGTPIGQPGDGYAEDGVEGGEGDAAEKAHQGVGNPEILLDWLHKDAEDRAVDEVEDVDDHQEAERVPAVERRKAPRRPGMPFPLISANGLNQSLPQAGKQLTHELFLFR